MDFKIVPLTDGTNKGQVEQFVAMMSRMYDFHATLHPDWQTRSGWQNGSAGWIKRAAGGDEYFFAMAYPTGPEGQETLDPPAGYVIASFHYEAPLFVQHRFGYIADLWVEEAYRRQGVAQKLLESTYAWFKAQGLNRVQLEVDVNNLGGSQFWQEAGFSPFEIVMRKDL